MVSRNFYTVKPLVGLNTSDNEKTNLIKEHIDWVTLNERSGDPHSGLKFNVTVRFATTVDLDTINQFIDGKCSERPQDAFKAVDIIMRHGPTVGSIVLGHNIFQKEEPGKPSADLERYKLTASKHVRFGHYQTMKTCAIGPVLNIDRTSAVFQECGPLIYIMANVKEMKTDELIRRLACDVNPDNCGFKSARGGKFNPRGRYNNSDSIIEQLISEFKGIKVSTTYGSYKRTFKLSKITSIAARAQTFDDFNNQNGLDSAPTVASYFKEKYGITGDDFERLKDLPCAQLGTPRRPVYIPITLLNVEPNQNLSNLKPQETANLIRHCSSQPTSGRFDVIKKSAAHVVDCEAAKETLSKFDLKMVSEPINVEGFVLDHPTLVYGAKDGEEHSPKDEYKPSHGRWSLASEHKLYKPCPPLRHWIIINFVPRFCSGQRQDQDFYPAFPSDRKSNRDGN